MSQQMLNFSEIKWNEIVDVDESPIAFCYRKDIPAYFRVDKYRQLVRYEYRLRAGIHHFVFSPVEKFSLQSPPWKSSLGIIFMEYPVEDFHEDIRFLRIEQSSLRLIANEGGAVISKFSRVGFSTTGPTRNSPIALCYRKDIPAYFRVDKYRQLFRYEYRLRAVIYHFVFSPVEKFSLQSPPWKSYLEILFMGYPVEDFYEDIRFLRLEQSSLRLIANEGGAVISTFSSVGLSTTGPTRNVGAIPSGRSFKVHENSAGPDMEKFEFDSAFLVDKELWELDPKMPVNGSFYPKMAVEGNSYKPEAFAIKVDVTESDLWFASIDIQSLINNSLEKRAKGLCPYPFTHKETMPGIYWIYQAAYAENRIGSITKKESRVERLKDIEKWLLANDKYAYRSRSVRSAKKFVPLQLERKKGKLRKQFVPDISIPEIGDGGKLLEAYQPDFISQELSCILKIADWWERNYQGVSEDRLKLAVKLDGNSFDGLELGDLVQLISEKPLSAKEICLFEAHLVKMGRDHKPYNFVDGARRPKPFKTKK